MPEKQARYRHTQVGYVIMIALGISLVAIACFLIFGGFNWALLIALIFLSDAVVFFGILTVTVNDEAVEIRFGPGIIRKKFLLRDIGACQVVKNPWYYGWGIHRIPSGWLFNVSGFEAVELQTRYGKKYRIGTDEPEKLGEAVQQALKR